MSGNFVRCRICLATFGLAVIAWWCMLFWYPRSQEWFFQGVMAQETFWTFLIADVVLLGIGPWVVFAATFVRPPLARPLLWLIFGATLYATLCCVVMFVRQECTILALGSMIAASVLVLGLVKDMKAAREVATKGGPGAQP